MSARLQQLNLKYIAEQDRLLFRMSTTEADEVRLWFTRKFVKMLWPALLKALALNPQVTAQADPATRQAVVAFQHEKAVAEADFEKPYREVTAKPPAGGEDDAAAEPPATADDEPLPYLVNGVRVRMQGPERPLLVFLTTEKQEVAVGFNLDLLHSFCRLLQSAMKAADWDLALELGETAEAPAARPPRLN